MVSLSIVYLDISIQSQLSLSYKIETEKWTSKQTEYICRVIKQSARGSWKEAGASFKKNNKDTPTKECYMIVNCDVKCASDHRYSVENIIYWTN